ncbi:hypothetical protein HPO_18742 [Hyphomonas polymorpha PS728]|uniref:Uncharacterized protein n=1 Tax=Hyphomonas polymorpha PS728 TaxID=1280954 RepID=A0A062VF92_9PROT|nr:hypothetical protein HPO_18742 [Hyphomonas polymorpha PS728]
MTDAPAEKMNPAHDHKSLHVRRRAKNGVSQAFTAVLGKHFVSIYTEQPASGTGHLIDGEIHLLGMIDKGIDDDAGAEIAGNLAGSI